MNLSSFEYFAVLSRERSFTHAARELHITQQTLSTHIASLENELGCQLIVRRMPLELTYEGTVFLRYSNQILTGIRNLHREFCDISENQRGILKIGIAATRGRAIMPCLISRFQKIYPNVEIQLIEGVNRSLQLDLQNGETDIAIAQFGNAPADIKTIDFYREKIVLLVPNKFPVRCLVRSENGIAIADIASLSECPLLLGSADDIAGHIGQTLIAKAGFAPIVRMRSENIETLLSMCALGAGACFCPSNLVRTVLTDKELEEINTYQLGGQAEYPIRFGILKTSYQWKIISEFIRIAMESYPFSENNERPC